MKTPFAELTIAFYLILVINVGCTKVETSGHTFYYDQSGCADQWDNDIQFSDDKFIVRTQKYLQANGILVEKIYNKKVADAQLCNACTCLSGVRIFIEIPESNISLAEQLGFTKL